MTKYETWYNNIIKNARKKNIGEGYEVHHIIPRCFGGDNSQENLVKLTPREHFVCHWILVKMHTGDKRGKMINALYMMRAEGPYQKRYHTKITSRIYQKLREEYAQYISKKNKGRKQPLEEKIKQIAAITGRKRAPFSDEWRAKLSESKKGKNNNRYGVIVSEKTREKMSQKAKGRKQSPETIAKKSEAIRGSKREKLLCPHCQQMIAVNTYSRWHGDNCKEKKN